MNMKKLILVAVAAGSLALGAAAAAGTPPDLTDEQKAKIEEMKAKLEAQREAWKAKHDSLMDAHKDEIAKRIAERKAGMGTHKVLSDSMRAQVKALLDEYKDKLKAVSDSDKAAIAKELAEKLKALRADMAGKLKADFEARKKEIEARRAEWLKNHPGGDSAHGGPRPTPEQLAEMKAKFEEWRKAHQARHDSTATP
jgi:hypothetical protein